MAENRFKAMGKNMYRTKPKDSTDSPPVNEEYNDDLSIANEEIPSGENSEDNADGNIRQDTSKDFMDSESVLDGHTNTQATENIPIADEKNPLIENTGDIAEDNTGQNISSEKTNITGVSAKKRKTPPLSKESTMEKAGNSTKRKRGRKEGTIIVEEAKRKKNVSISMSPEDEALYKTIINESEGKFVSMSHLVNLALKSYLKELIKDSSSNN